jgi:Uma2 family endonuclease
MTAAKKLNLVSVEDYLAAELNSPIRHEYFGGMVYAMAETRNAHNVIVGNVLAFLDVRLRGQRCKPFNSSTKVRIRFPTHLRFYYPDVSVVCQPSALEESSQDNPAVLVEVLSRSTRRFDDVEKKDAYLTIPSLSVYLLIEQEMPAVVVFRRADQGFVREVYEGLDAVIPLPEIGTELPLAEIYEAVDFVPEADEDAEV